MIAYLYHIGNDAATAAIARQRGYIIGMINERCYQVLYFKT